VHQHGGTTEEDEHLHEEHVQSCAHAVHQPRRDRASRDARHADDEPGQKRLGVEQVEALEKRRLREVDDDRDHRVGGEHRGRSEPGAEQKGNKNHARAARDAGGEAEHARAHDDARRMELDFPFVQDSSDGHRSDHGAAEHDAQRARIEHAVKPGAQHEEGQRRDEDEAEHAPLEHRAVKPEAAGVDDDAGDGENWNDRLHADERHEGHGEDDPGAEAAHPADRGRHDGEQRHGRERRRVEQQPRSAARGAAARRGRWRRR
jgi:hypothetical protein